MSMDGLQGMVATTAACTLAILANIFTSVYLQQAESIPGGPRGFESSHWILPHLFFRIPPLSHSLQSCTASLAASSGCSRLSLTCDALHLYKDYLMCVFRSRCAQSKDLFAQLQSSGLYLPGLFSISFRDILNFKMIYHLNHSLGLPWRTSG